MSSGFTILPYMEMKKWVCKYKMLTVVGVLQIVKCLKNRG